MNDYFVFTDEQAEYLRKITADLDGGLSPYATKNSDAVYLEPRDGDPLRPAFSRDADFIINSPFYNRYADKTQVFSFYKNDDLTRRALHVQLVSKIAGTIGRALRLNCELIEAVALAHDMGHTPFGHKGETYLSEVYHAHTGRYFNHNVHGARIFRKIFDCRLSLQTLSGILAHNGEKPAVSYAPQPLASFKEFDEILERCYTEDGFSSTLRPSTLEGCVVRIADVIAYVGKDRQDLYRASLLTEKSFATDSILGRTNREIISGLTANIVKNSIDSPSLNMDEEVFNAMQRQLRENYEIIYNNQALNEPYETIVKPLMSKLYDRLLEDAVSRNPNSPIMRHYAANSPLMKRRYLDEGLINNPDDAVTDFIASMTDDYFIDVCKHLHVDDGLTEKAEKKYVGYFD